MGERAGREIAKTKLEARAIQERWQISPFWRERILKRMMRVIDDESAGHREATAAARALIAADGQNLAEQKINDGWTQEELFERFNAIVEARVQAELANRQFARIEQQQQQQAAVVPTPAVAETTGVPGPDQP